MFIFWLVWILVGLFGIYRFLICEKKSTMVLFNKLDLDKNNKINFKFESVEWWFFSLCSLLGPITIFIWIFFVLVNIKDLIKYYRMKSKLKSIKPKLTLKQERAKKLKKINRFRIFRYASF
jgi:hypothetical protein